jgi:CubicO group peptidase (beta-lactamase class C family)
MPFASFADQIQAAVSAIHYPGVAVLVMHRGKIATMVGAGSRQLGCDTPIGPGTLFEIGSDTKPINAIIINMLVDEGLLDWDAPIQRYLPWFAVSDPWISSHATLADLAMHRLGVTSRLLRLPRDAAHSSRWRVEAFRHLAQTGAYRDSMQYSNEGYEALALIAEAVTGQTMQSLVEQRLFAPLGMRHAVTDRAALVRKDKLGPSIEAIAPGARGDLSDFKLGVDGALGHFRSDGDPTWKPCQPYFIPYGGSGISLSMADAVHYLTMLLAKGGDLISPASFSRLINPRALLRHRIIHEGEDQTQHLATGFITEYYRGHAMIGHTGSMPGYRSSIGFVPSLDLGYAIFQNARCADGTGEIFRPIMQLIMDRALGTSYVDHIGAMHRRDQARLVFVAASNLYIAGNGPRPESDTTLPNALMAVESLYARYVGHGPRDPMANAQSLGRFTGTYRDKGELFGPAKVLVTNSGATLAFPWSSPFALHPWTQNMAIFQSQDHPQTMIGQVKFASGSMTIDRIRFDLEAS